MLQRSWDSRAAVRSSMDSDELRLVGDREEQPERPPDPFLSCQSM